MSDKCYKHLHVVLKVSKIHCLFVDISIFHRILHTKTNIQYALAHASDLFLTMSSATAENTIETNKQNNNVY